MSPDLTRKLFESYPILYQGRKRPITENLMGFGFACGDGWYEIIDDLSRQIEEYNQTAESPVVATQVKEKLGGLRFDAFNVPEYIYTLIEDAESKSEHTCEMCGRPGEINSHGWLSCLCDECREKDDPDLYFEL